MPQMPSADRPVAGHRRAASAETQRGLALCTGALIMAFAFLTWLEASLDGDVGSWWSGSGRITVLAALLSVPAVALGAWIVGRLHPGLTFGRRLVGVGVALCTLTFLETEHWQSTWSDPVLVLCLVGLALSAGSVAAVAADQVPSGGERRLPRPGLGDGLRRRLGVAAALILCSALALPLLSKDQGAAGRGSAARDPSEKTGPDTGRRPDVVLISVDTLRNDRLDRADLMPQLRRAAVEGTRFHRAVAAAPWTVPSVAALLTGLDAEGHGAGKPLATSTYRRSGLRQDVDTLAERFAAVGYRTRAIVANAFLGPHMGMDQGFESLTNPLLQLMRADRLARFPVPRFLLWTAPAGLLGDPRAGALTDAGLAELEAVGEAPLFLWLHYIDPHVPYLTAPDAPRRFWGLPARDPAAAPWDAPGFAAVQDLRAGRFHLSADARHRVETLYDLNVAYLDRELGRLFDGLRAHRAGRPTVAVVVSDHGEELWEHGGFEHGHDYYTEVTRVPLVFWGDGVPAGRDVDEAVGHVDVAPTLWRLAVGRPGRGFDGVSLDALWRSDAAPGLLPPRLSHNNLYGLPAVLVEDESRRFILRANGEHETYDLEVDPAERFPIPGEPAPSLLARARDILKREQSAAVPQTTTEEHLDALRSLGYAH